MSAPKRLRVEYEDGSTREIDFAKIDGSIVIQLAKLGLCPAPQEITSSKHYVILRWKDGWQEVIGVDHDTADLLRYYVIARIEDRARLSLEVGEYWPELFIIKRTPRDVTSILIVGNGGAKLYPLEEEMERWEGTFEAGGKKEYVKFDKINPRTPQACVEAPEELSQLAASLKGELARLNVPPQALLAMDTAKRIEIYGALARALGFRGHERQADVYGLIELLVKRLVSEA
jgi:hypothetical protein